MNEQAPVLVDTRDGIMQITLNRPERKNAWTVQVQREYFGALQAAAEDPDVTVVVLTGAGGSFCPGADTDALSVYGDTGTTNPEAAEIVQPEWFPTLLRKPLIAAIEGPCAGVGLAHALMCDIRVAAEDARFSTAFARRSLPPMHGTTWLLERAAGATVAYELLLTARTFTGREAAALGVVTESVEPGTALARARAIAEDMVRTCSPTAMASIKEHLALNHERALREAIESVDATLDEFLSSADFREGVTSFLERRPPRFGGLDSTKALAKETNS